MKKLVLCSLIAIGISMFLYSCRKELRNPQEHQTKNQVDHLGETASRFNNELFKIYTESNGYGFDLELMEDTTWAGNLIVNYNDYYTPSFTIQTDSNFSYYYTEHVNGEDIIASIKLSANDSLQFLLGDFEQVDDSTFTFNQKSLTNDFIRSFTVTSTLFSDESELKAMFSENPPPSLPGVEILVNDLAKLFGWVPSGTGSCAGAVAAAIAACPCGFTIKYTDCTYSCKSCP